MDTINQSALKNLPVSGCVSAVDVLVNNVAQLRIGAVYHLDLTRPVPWQTLHWR